MSCAHTTTHTRTHTHTQTHTHTHTAHNTQRWRPFRRAHSITAAATGSPAAPEADINVHRYSTARTLPVSDGKATVPNSCVSYFKRQGHLQAGVLQMRRASPSEHTDLALGREVLNGRLVQLTPQVTQCTREVLLELSTSLQGIRQCLQIQVFRHTLSHKPAVKGIQAPKATLRVCRSALSHASPRHRRCVWYEPARRR